MFFIFNNYGFGPVLTNVLSPAAGVNWIPSAQKRCQIVILKIHCYYYPSIMIFQSETTAESCDSSLLAFHPDLDRCEC